MTIEIQYASQLFLSASKTPLIRPKAPILVLTGNTFCHGSTLNSQHMKYLSESWNNVYIIPGPLEYSSLNQSITMDFAERHLMEEIDKYANISYLNRKQVQIAGKVNLFGLTKWSPFFEGMTDDSMNLYSSYKINSLYWKVEEDEWLRDELMRTAPTDINIVASYYCPFVCGIGSKYKSVSKAKFHSSFNSSGMSIHSWIYGIPGTTMSGMHNNMFIGCNSYGAPGFYEGMVISVNDRELQ